MARLLTSPIFVSLEFATKGALEEGVEEICLRITKLDYCQYLLSSQTNYTLTNLAEHLQVFSHDTINRYLRQDKLTPRLLWDNVEHLIQADENGSIIFDDSVIDKNCSNCIQLVRRQYSGAEHRVIRGIGLI